MTATSPSPRICSESTCTAVHFCAISPSLTSLVRSRTSRSHPHLSCFSESGGPFRSGPGDDSDAAAWSFNAASYCLRLSITASLFLSSAFCRFDSAFAAASCCSYCSSRDATHGIRPARRAFGPHFWTSLQPRAAAGACCNQVASGSWFWCTIEGRSPRQYFENKSTSKKPELANLQPKTLRNWTSLSAAVHFFGPHSLSPFGPHWSPTREH